MKIVNAEISTCRLYKSEGWYWWEGRILTNCEQNEIPMNFMNNLLILQSFTQSLQLIYFSLTIIINLYVIINL